MAAVSGAAFIKLQRAAEYLAEKPVTFKVAGFYFSLY